MRENTSGNLSFYFDDFENRHLIIHVSDSALMHLMLAGIESFRIRIHGGEAKENYGPVETAGILWGHFLQKRETDHVFVDQVTNDTYAEKHRSSVSLNPTATKVKQRIVDSRWPHMSFVGDFHTHPYPKIDNKKSSKNYWTLKNVIKDGWKFSDGDYDFYESRSGYQPSEWDGRIALVLSVAEPQRVHDVDPKLIRPNTLMWQFEEFRLFLAAYSVDVLPTKGEESRFIVSPPRDDVDTRTTRPKRPYVFIDVPTISGTNAWYKYSFYDGNVV